VLQNDITSIDEANKTIKEMNAFIYKLIEKLNEHENELIRPIDDKK
jgi:hypothetical protein